jgi:hypothetical protein
MFDDAPCFDHGSQRNTERRRTRDAVKRKQIMEILTEAALVQTILERGPVTPEEFARMAYPVRAAYLTLMLSWAKERGLDHLTEQREALKPMILRGLEEVAEMIDVFWKRENEQSDKTE